MNGLLVVDKPAGMTSHDVVGVVRRVTGERSVGHLGTLDPMATGVLPLLLGRWTRLAQFFGTAEKEYTGRIRFGWATDSYDADGEQVGDRRALEKSLEQLQALARGFVGELEQMPPVYSAKKVDGVAAHTRARAGEAVRLRPARVVVHAFSLDGLEGDEASFRIRVSAGGYVRSVAHELGVLAGCGAHLSELRRTHAGAFELEHAVSLEELKAMAGVREGEIARRMVHPRQLLPEMAAVTVDEYTAGRLRNGMQANLPEFSRVPMLRIFTGPHELFAIGRRVAGTLIQPTVVLG